MIKWWKAKVNNRQKLNFQAIPTLILWFLWKRRNSVVHGSSYTTGNVIWDINDMVRKIIINEFGYDQIPTNWPQVVALIDGFRPKFKAKWVRWYPPPCGWWKCNTNGASRGNPGPSSAAFCVRNHEGYLLCAKGITIPDSYSLVAEVIAIRIGLQFCLENQIPNIIVESDSLAIVNIINGVWKILWRVTVEVNSIRKMMNSWPVRVQHSLREGNTLADFLANLVFHFAGNFDF
uniref:Reverse transcriptase n=1 Tax=Solanum tuberosum TaxID=4113 RepID=M1D7E5_SOLTU